MHSEFKWPDLAALMDEFADYFDEIGQSLHISNMADLEAGFERARNASNYLPDADAAQLAALIFVGIVTRHALVDGNKRLAWLAMATFLDLNDIWFDAGERAAADMALSVVSSRATVEEMAEFIRSNTSAWPADSS